MFAVAVVTDHLADICLERTAVIPSSHVHLINDVALALKRAQVCRLDYLNTGDTARLDAYREACSEVDLSMDRLVSEDHEVTSLLAHAEGLRAFVHAKLSEIGKSLATAPAAAKPPVAAPEADSDLARIQKLLDSLAQEESRDISNEMEATQARALFHHNLVIALAVINGLFLVGVAFCASQIGKLHSLITMCAWSKRVQYQDKWIPLEEYLRKRFGIRISHGISEEEYNKWAGSEIEEAPPASTAPAHTPASKATV
jgi:CHASE3 domain sensor protein